MGEGPWYERAVRFLQAPASIVDPRRRRRIWLSQTLALVAAGITVVVFALIAVLDPPKLSLLPVVCALSMFAGTFALCRTGYDRLATWALLLGAQVAPLVGAVVNREPLFGYQLYSVCLPGFAAAMLLSSTEAAATVSLGVIGVAVLPAVSTLTLDDVLGPLVFGGMTIPVVALTGVLVASDLRRMQEARDAAEAANAAMAHFLARAGHELRTPLTSIKGFVDLAVEDVEGGRTQNLAQDLGTIKTSCTHLLKIVEEVMLLSQLDGGRLSFEPSEFILSDVARECAEMARPLALENHNTIEVGGLSDAPVLADRRRTAQVLLNLLANACRYTDSGVVAVRCREEAGRVRVEIQDTGVGLSAEEQARIFDEFWRARPTGPRTGTGLGLSIARQLARAMGGDIDVVSAEGQGSTFSLHLPMARAEK